MAAPNTTFLAAGVMLVRTDSGVWLNFTAPDGAVLQVALSGAHLIALGELISVAAKEEPDLPSWPPWQPN